jgi:hypothetical protein
MKWKMSTTFFSYVHFFDTLRDIIVSKPYAILSSEEVNSLLNQIDSLAKAVNAHGEAFEHVCAFRQAIDNAKSDGYFPVVIFPDWKYEVVILRLKTAS